MNLKMKKVKMNNIIINPLPISTLEREYNITESSTRAELSRSRDAKNNLKGIGLRQAQPPVK